MGHVTEQSETTVLMGMRKTTFMRQNENSNLGYNQVHTDEDKGEVES